MIGHKNVIGIITMSLLVFIIAACNPSSQDVYEELSKTEITDNGPASTIERNDSNEVVKDTKMIMTIGDTKVGYRCRCTEGLNRLVQSGKA